jgi:hypothetical protein
VPAVRCELFGRTADITASVVTEQVRLAVLRLGDQFDLWDVRQKFFQRSFSFQTLVFDSPLARGRHEKKSTDTSLRKQTATLRSAASDLSKAELEPVYGRDRQVREVAEYLVGQSPQSVLLVGPVWYRWRLKSGWSSERFGLLPARAWSQACRAWACGKSVA